jgi:hypothetical protein
VTLRSWIIVAFRSAKSAPSLAVRKYEIVEDPLPPALCAYFLAFGNGYAFFRGAKRDNERLLLSPHIGLRPYPETQSGRTEVSIRLFVTTHPIR